MFSELTGFNDEQKKTEANGMRRAREQAESKEKARRDEEPPGLEEVERVQEAHEEEKRA